MSPEEIARLDRARATIVRRLNPVEPPFLEHLRAERVLSDSDVERIENTTNNHSCGEGTRKLLEIYQRKAKSLDPLINALNICCYQNLINALTQPMEPDSDAPTAVSKLTLFGGVPRNPEVHVDRAALRSELLAALAGDGGNEIGRWIIIHGMPGIGKSVLAASALLDPSVAGSVFTNVLWLNVGQRGDDDLLWHLRELFHTLDASEGRLSCDSLDILTRKLRQLFIFEYPKALVVLNDVWTESVVRAFDDIRCNVLMTTRDATLLDRINATKKWIYLPNSGFSLPQTLDAFSKWSRLDGNALPKEAAQIVIECDGHPFVISLIGALLREHPDRWTHYHRLLRDRRLAEISKSTTYPFDNFISMASASLDKLTGDLLDHIWSLGAFERGNAISLKELMTLWQKDKIAVEDVMGILYKKSLIERRRNPPLEESYHVHVLLHDTLKSLVGSDAQDASDTFLAIN